MEKKGVSKTETRSSAEYERVSRRSPSYSRLKTRLPKKSLKIMKPKRGGKEAYTTKKGRRERLPG